MSEPSPRHEFEPKPAPWDKFCQKCGRIVDIHIKRTIAAGEPSSAPPAISDEFVAAVEDEIGMGAGAWDMIHPEEICRAVIKVYRGVRSGAAQEVSPAK